MEITNGKVTHIRCVRLSDGQHRHLAVLLAENDSFLEYNNWKREDPEYDEWLINNKNKKVTIAPQVIKKENVDSPIVTELSDKAIPVEQPEAKSDKPKKRQKKQKPQNV